jgi:hypothetical protein
MGVRDIPKQADKPARVLKEPWDILHSRRWVNRLVRSHPVKLESKGVKVVSPLETAEQAVVLRRDCPFVIPQDHRPHNKDNSN